MKIGDKVRILESATKTGIPSKYIGHTATEIITTKKSLESAVKQEKRTAKNRRRKRNEERNGNVD